MRLLTVILLTLSPAALAAQAAPMAMAMDHGAMSMPTPLTPHAKAQVERARLAAAELDTPEKARAAGYRPRCHRLNWRGRPRIATRIARSR